MLFQVFEAQAIPESHPVLPRLNELFGDHTFFVDSNGLNIVERTDEPVTGRTQAARVVNVANWSDENLSSLAAHEPEPTDAVAAEGRFPMKTVAEVIGVSRSNLIERLRERPKTRVREAVKV